MLNLVFVREVSCCCCCLHHDCLYYYVLDVCVGWIVRNGICYKRFDDVLTADASVSLCESHNAYLAEIPNIYVDNIVTDIVREVYEYSWIGLRTNDTHYYWRNGDFPLGKDAPSEMNYCGSLTRNTQKRWRLYKCDIDIIRSAICMIGKQFHWLQIQQLLSLFKYLIV